MLKETLRKIYRAFADGLGGFKDAIRGTVPKKKKKEDEEDAELEWWEEAPDAPKDKKVTIRKKFRNITRKFTTGPKPLPGPRRIKRLIALLLFLIHIGIIIFIVRQNVYVGIFFVLTAYTILDYLALTRETGVWDEREP